MSETFTGKLAEWFQKHTNRFPQLKNYFMRDESIIVQWSQRLQRYPVEALIYATDKMMLISPSPFPSDHLGKIDALAISFVGAQKLRPEVKDEDLPTSRVKCDLCSDSGAVEIANPKHIEEARNGHLGYMYSCVAACNCGKGTALAKSKDDPFGKGLPRVRATDYQIDHSKNYEDNRTGLIEWASSMEKSVRNYASEFSPSHLAKLDEKNSDMEDF